MLLAIRKMQIEMTVRYHVAPTKMAKMKRWLGGEETRILILCWRECKNALEKRFGSF